MASVHPVTISCSDSLFERIERARGLEPRAAWIKRAIERSLSPGPPPLSMDTGEPLQKVPVVRDPPRVGSPARPLAEPGEVAAPKQTIVPKQASSFRRPLPSEVAKLVRPARSLVDPDSADLPKIAKRQ